MVIGLHDSDKTGFPNLALMKLSAWHKVLVQDIASAERRAVALRDMGAEVFAQPYRDFENKIAPSPEQKRFARWVNHKAIFKTVKRFSEYNAHLRRAGI